MQKIFGENFKWFTCCFLLATGVTYALGSYMQFHVAGNDYWGILYYGRHMTLSEPESLYNGFFPIGYAFLIGQLPFTYVLSLSYIINALLTGLFVASVSTLVIATRSTLAALTAFFLAIAAPFVFQNAHILGPDIGSAAFTAFAIFLLWQDELAEKRKNLTDLQAVFIGASLGLAFLWRSHAVVSSLAIFFGYFMLNGIQPLRSRLLMIAAFLCLASLQIIVNLLSGHGALETAQAFNIYKFFHGIDPTISPTPAEIEKFSLINTIIDDPKRAFDLYILPFKYLLSFAWPSLICFLLAPKGRISRYSLFAMIFIFLYAIPVSIGDSARAPVTIMSVYTSSLALLFVVLMDHVKKISTYTWMPAVMGVLFIAFGSRLFYGWVLQDIQFVKASYAERKSLGIIEEVLLSHGMETPSEVFSDRYDFYTPHKMPYLSRQIRTTLDNWFWGFSEEFPSLPNDSWESFAQACKEQGIRFLVLSPNSFYRGDIFPPIYNEEVDLQSLGLKFIAQIGKKRIYQFK